MGILDKMKKRRFAEGGRTYTPLANNADYFTYGSGPEHQFFSGNLPTAPVLKVSDPTKPGPTTQDANTNWGNVVSGIGSLGQTISLAGQVAQGAGYDNAVTQGMVKYGDMASNPAKAVKGIYQGSGSAPAAGSAGAADAGVLGGLSGGAGAVFGTSGAGALGASGATAGLGDLGTATAGELFGTSGSAAAGAGAGSLGGASVSGLGAGTGASSGAAGAGGAGAAGAGLSGAAAGGIGMALVDLYSKYASQHGDESRNLAAYQQAFPGVDMSHYARSRGNMLGQVTLPDGTKMTSGEFDRLAGEWYGATYSPDGNQSDWQKEYEATLAGLKKPKHATGGSIHGSLGTTLVNHFRSGGDQYVKGPGTGRSDEIPAQLSDGEYVMDAETVAMLGDGSSDAGAKKLDTLRENLRKHKGRTLAKGKFSPDAKQPAQYMGRK